MKFFKDFSYSVIQQTLKLLLLLKTNPMKATNKFRTVSLDELAVLVAATNRNSMKEVSAYSFNGTDGIVCTGTVVYESFDSVNAQTKAIKTYYNCKFKIATAIAAIALPPSPTKEQVDAITAMNQQIALLNPLLLAGIEIRDHSTYKFSSVEKENVAGVSLQLFIGTPEKGKMTDEQFSKVANGVLFWSAIEA